MSLLFILLKTRNRRSNVIIQSERAARLIEMYVVTPVVGGIGGGPGRADRSIVANIRNGVSVDTAGVGPDGRVERLPVRFEWIRVGGNTTGSRQHRPGHAFPSGGSPGGHETGNVTQRARNKTVSGSEVIRA
jgi:hypothetical protein